MELPEWTGNDMAQAVVDLSFRFPQGQLAVVNALDENGLTFALPRAPREYCLP
ncbi:hypothetical protein [Streptomyces sp. NPDC048637]|uniref:hypothetical protein n=1 Tax=Streptomyces sp. NPDC048637 TaxID=3155636 RepID=UPI00343BD472